MAIIMVIISLCIEKKSRKGVTECVKITKGATDRKRLRNTASEGTALC